MTSVSTDTSAMKRLTRLLELLRKCWSEISRRLLSATRRSGDRLRDVIDGVETARIVEAPDINTTSANKTRGIRYQPTPERPLRKLLSTLQIPPGEVFIDIGAGKGRVLLIARSFGFAKLVGIDYSAELCRIAARNLDVAYRRRRTTMPVLIHCCDAAEYTFPENESVIYLFNPFDAFVLSKMLDRLAESLRRAPRRLWLIYHFPRWHEEVEARGIFGSAGVYRYGADEFAVYVHERPGDATSAHDTARSLHNPASAPPLEMDRSL